MAADPEQPQPTSAADPGFRVEELAARTGAPVRTIREYQTWQILHPPTRVGRVGYYDESHVRRLEGIDRLQQRGYSIAAIRDLFEAWEQGAGLRDVLGVDDAIGLPADEAPVALTTEQFNALLPAVASSTRLRARAVKVGLVAEDGEWIVARSPALLQLVADAIGAGLAPTRALDLAEAVVASADHAGRAAAEAVAAAAVGGDDGDAGVEHLVRRGRVLLARAIASHTIDQVGRHLRLQASDMPELVALLDDIRIGTVTRVPAPDPPAGPARGGRATRP